MTLSFDQIYQAALLLPDDSKVNLVDKMLKSIEHNMLPEINKAWMKEVRRRFEEIRSGKVEPISGDVVMAKARAMLAEK